MKRLLFLLVLLPSLGMAADITIIGQPITAYEDGTPITAAVTYVWFQGATADSVRQVGETTTPTFQRNGQSNTNHCFAYQVRVADGQVPTGPTLNEVSPAVCRDFSPVAVRRIPRGNIVSVAPRQ